MELTDSLKTMLIETAKSLKGSDRRLFMARTVKELGPGGQARAARELHWGRMTIRKGLHELDTGIRCADAFTARGRKRAEVHLPNLLPDLQAIVDSQALAPPAPPSPPAQPAQPTPPSPVESKPEMPGQDVARHFGAAGYALA